LGVKVSERRSRRDAVKVDEFLVALHSRACQNENSKPKGGRNRHESAKEDSKSFGSTNSLSGKRSLDFVTEIVDIGGPIGPATLLANETMRKNRFWPARVSQSPLVAIGLRRYSLFQLERP
jgi:hypothetical protein